jgi:CBS domain-containing protein
VEASPDDPVAKAMRSKPYAVTPDTRLCDAAARLCSLRLGCLPVVERTDVRPALVGIITEVDLLLAAYQSG